MVLTTIKMVRLVSFCLATYKLPRNWNQVILFSTISPVPGKASGT